MHGDRRRVRVRGLIVSNHFSQAEVEHLHRAVGPDDHVGRFEIAMNNAPRVRGGERVGHGNGHPERVGKPQALPRNQRIEAFAPHVLHHDEIVIGRRLDLVNRDDVRMIERGCRLRLLDEAPAAALVGQAIGRQHLDGHFAAEPRVAGAIDFAHAPGTDWTEHLIRTEPCAGGERHGGCDYTSPVWGAGSGSR